MIGAWGEPFNHQLGANITDDYQPFHMSVIPVDTSGTQPGNPNIDHRGHVVIWGQDGVLAAGNTVPWTILDPETGTFWDQSLTLPRNNFETNDPEDGDISCSGHAWTAQGNLFVAGGSIYDTSLTPPPGGINGCRLAYIWDPRDWWKAGTPPADDHGWYYQGASRLLAWRRYYPSVTRYGENKLLVSGGWDLWNNWNPPSNQGSGSPALVASNYEVFEVNDLLPHTGTWDEDLLQNRIYQGPESPGESELNYYPRFHLMSEDTGMAHGSMFYAGFAVNTGRFTHDENVTNPTWDHSVGQQPVPDLTEYLQYGCSVLMPIDLNASNSGRDQVMRMGGGLDGGPDGYWFNSSTVPQNKVEICNLRSETNKGWVAAAPMKQARWLGNAVILPDGSTLFVGGQRVAAPTPYPTIVDSEFVMSAEFYSDGVWTETADMQNEQGVKSPRDYHSTAVLLPSGKVLVGGGEHRRWDY